jgi:uncharacterized small protein (DUF1192 family)
MQIGIAVIPDGSARCHPALLQIDLALVAVVWDRVIPLIASFVAPVHGVTTWRIHAPPICSFLALYPWKSPTRPDSGTNMSNDHSLSLSELNARIALIQNNIRQLVEQAAASLGAQDEERTSGRIAQQQEELDKLVMERDALLKK